MPRMPLALESLLLGVLLRAPEPVQRRLAGPPVEADGNTLALEVQLLLRLKELAGVPPVEDLPVAQGRVELRRQAQVISRAQRIGAVRDLRVPGAEGELPARLYTPTSRLGEESLPTLLFLHGGGFVYGGLDSHDGAVRHLAEQSGVQVLSVEYRKAPEHPFPAGYQDALAACRWLLANPGEVGADPARVGVGGDSAGGNLAAAVALQAAEEGLSLAFQLLVYPIARMGGRSKSRDLFANGFFLTERFMSQVDEWYLSSAEDYDDPRSSVLLADVPAGLAPALVVTAGFDPLRDEGREYAAKLAEAGVAVEHVEFADAIHSFFNQVGVGSVMASHNREVAARLGRALA